MSMLSYPVPIVAIIRRRFAPRMASRSEEHTSELQSQSNLVCRLLLEKKNIFTHKARLRTVRLKFGQLDCFCQLTTSSSYALSICWSMNAIGCLVYEFMYIRIGV